MKIHIIEGGIVRNTALFDSESDARALYPNATVRDAAMGGSVGDLWDGVRFSPPPARPLSIAEVQQAVQIRLDDWARTRNYDGILSACTYATSKNPQFQKEGQAAVNARDACWAACYAILGEIQSGKRPVPTDFAEVETHLPALSWGGA